MEMMYQFLSWHRSREFGVDSTRPLLLLGCAYVCTYVRNAEHSIFERTVYLRFLGESDVSLTDICRATSRISKCILIRDCCSLAPPIVHYPDLVIALDSELWNAISFCFAPAFIISHSWLMCFSFKLSAIDWFITGFSIIRFFCSCNCSTDSDPHMYLV